MKHTTGSSRPRGRCAPLGASTRPLCVKEKSGFYMEGSDLSVLIIFAAIGFIWVLPILIIISSNKTSGGEKFAWVLAVIFVSWFAWIFYMLLAPIKNKN